MGRKFKNMQTPEEQYAASRRSTPQQTPAAMLQRADEARRKADELNTQSILNGTYDQNRREIKRLQDESWAYGVRGRRARREEQEAAERKKRRWF
ncbi:hypothetical protein ACWET9_06475 [Streptomyces sp. NPDC004059]